MSSAIQLFIQELKHLSLYSTLWSIVGYMQNTTHSSLALFLTNAIGQNSLRIGDPKRPPFSSALLRKTGREVWRVRSRKSRVHRAAPCSGNRWRWGWSLWEIIMLAWGAGINDKSWGNVYFWVWRKEAGGQTSYPLDLFMNFDQNSSVSAPFHFPLFGPTSLWETPGLLWAC